MKRLVVMGCVALFAIGVHAAHGEFAPDAKSIFKISVDADDVKVSFDGRVREEYFYFDKVSTLRSDTDDTFFFFRNKMNFGAYAEYGQQTYGEPVAMAKLRMCAFNYWDHPDQYAATSKEKILMNKGRFRDEIELGDDHIHGSAIPMVYQDEAWVGINFDALFKEIPVPISYKVGYLPFSVGRGITLGDYHEGSVSYMGWQDRTYESNATQAPQGMLLSVEFSEKAQLDLYYSKWRSYSTTPKLTREATKGRRLDVNTLEDDPRKVERGTKADRDLYAARMLVDLPLPSGGSINLEPYFVYVNVPEQMVEMQSDASTELWTWGMMAELKTPSFQCNIEFAKQSGYQQMHAMDRLRQELSVDKETGAMESVYSHLLQEGSLTAKQAVSDAVSAVAYLPQNRYEGAEDGHVLTKADGSTFTTAGDATVATMSYPFLRQSRFRPAYTLTYNGYMALIDCQYIAPSQRLRIGAAGAIISGDAYPYNEMVNKEYKGFLPLRDQNYTGHFVRSFAMLYGRKLPRPTDVSDDTMYAFNNDEDCSNLRYVGAGVQWQPARDPRAMTVIGSVLSFWQDAPPHAWDKTASRTYDNPVHSTIYAAAQNKLGFVGDRSEALASSHLGWELSACVLWHILPSCEISLIGSVFLPGQLYNDVDGAPNYNARRIRPNGAVWYDSLGSEPVWGGCARISFVF